MGIAQTLRKEITKYGAYATQRDVGISSATLYRFQRGTDALKLETLQLLCDFFDLELTKRKSRRAKE